MIKNEFIEVNISYRNITHYLKLGYIPVLNKSLKINIHDLPIVSHVKIEVICEICSKENKIMYCKYIDNKNRHGYYGCRKCSRQKAMMTCIDLYGVDSYNKTYECKEKIERNNINKYGVKTTLLDPSTIKKRKKTMIQKYGSEYTYNSKELVNKIKKTLLDKYGTDHYSKTQYFRQKIRYESAEIKNIKYKVGMDLKNSSSPIVRKEYDESILTKSYKLYRNECRRITIKNVKTLFINWNGLDYYDDEYIAENYKLDINDAKYPTIDHKISIIYGYINDISPEKIGDISNLCITKRFINSTKREMIEDEFTSKSN
jgi:hypothetical protein